MVYTWGLVVAARELRLMEVARRNPAWYALDALTHGPSIFAIIIMAHAEDQQIGA